MGALSYFFHVRSDAVTFGPFIYVLCVLGLTAIAILNSVFGFATEAFGVAKLGLFVILSIVLRTLRGSREWVRLIMVYDAFAVLGVISHISLIVPWQVQAFALPLWDDALHRFDLALGFDYGAYVGFLNAHSRFIPILVVAYGSFVLQVMLLVPLLAMLGRICELERYMASFIIGLGITCLVSVLMPTAGPILGLDPALAGTPAWPYAATDLTAYFGLRDGSLRQLVGVPQLGIISFPSFHVTSGVLVTFSLRSIPMLFWPVLALNIVMTVATVSCGGHYVADAIGGIAVAALAIAVAWHGCALGRQVASRVALFARARWAGRLELVTSQVCRVVAQTDRIAGSIRARSTTSSD